MYNLPIEYWHEEILVEIARSVRTPLKIDGNSMHGFVGHYAMVLIEIDMVQQLQSSVMINRGVVSFFIDLHYKSLPLFCNECQMVGHSLSKCRKHRSMSQNETSKAEAVHRTIVEVFVAASKNQGDVPSKKGQSTKEWVIKDFGEGKSQNEAAGFDVPVSNVFLALSEEPFWVSEKSQNDLETMQAEKDTSSLSISSENNVDEVSSEARETDEALVLDMASDKVNNEECQDNISLDEQASSEGRLKGAVDGVASKEAPVIVPKCTHNKRNMPTAAELRRSRWLRASRGDNDKDLGVSEVVSNGLFFTWSSQRFFPQITKSKIDCALISDEFQNNWAAILAYVLPRMCSDHSPIVVCCNSLQFQSSGPRPFKFWNMWVTHDSFLSMVKKSWNNEVVAKGCNRLFFHDSVHARRAKATISMLSINGEVVHDQEEIANHVIQHFEKLFSASGVNGGDLSIVDKFIPKLVSNQQSYQLTIECSFEEVKAAIFSLDPNSAVGPDGYTGKIPLGLNSSFLILIPKKDRATTVEDYRPNALSNFLFKILTKFLAMRLNDVASRIVTKEQFGFIQGRYIHDAIAIASEGVNALN
ncbi:hypothetical protein C2S52_013942 [Perilla frutescens var. hirtella]|nr:hypothetical protein C2S52_013942 [Perilla frutescens var. hirtella]